MTDVVLISLLLVPLQIAADQLGLKTVLGRWASALIYLLLSFALFAYYILFEGLNRGRTPGKILLGIRVVMDTGRPITLAAAALRNLVRAAEYAGLLLPAALTMLLHRSNKRLGDLAAGTIVVRDHATEWGLAPPARAGEDPVEVGPPELSEEEFRLLDRLLARLSDLTPEVQVRMTVELARRFETRVPRRTTDPQEYLVARTPADRALRLTGLPGGGRGIVALRAGRVPAVHRPGGRGLRRAARAARTGRGDRPARHGESRRAGSGAPGPRRRLRAGGERRPTGARLLDHQQQHHGVPRGARRRPGRGCPHGALPRVQRPLAGRRLRRVRESPCRRLPRHVHRRARRVGADGRVHLRWRRVPPGPSPGRARGPHPHGRPRAPRRRCLTHDRIGGVPAHGGRRDRGFGFSERRRSSLQVRRQRRVGGAPGVLFRERVGLPQGPGQRNCARRGGHRSHRHDPTLRRRRDHHRAGGEDRGRCGRLTGSSVQGFEDVAHLARERLDLLQAPDRLRVILVGTQQEQLGLGEDRSQGVRQVVPELPDGVQRVDHLKQRAVEIAQMVIPQVPHRLPQVRLLRGAEDLRGGALRLRVRRPEQHPPAPDPVLGAAYLEANGDELSVESDGGKVVDDRFGRIGCVVACRLSGHADPRAGLCKDIRVAHLRNTFRGSVRVPTVWART